MTLTVEQSQAALKIIELQQRIQYLTVARAYISQALPYENKVIVDKINLKIKKFQKEIRELEK